MTTAPLSLGPMERHTPRAIAAVSLCCLFLACSSGCAGDKNGKDTTPALLKNSAAPITTRLSPELERSIDPSPWKLGPEAEHLYYHLVLADGISDNSGPVIKRAIMGLLKLDQSLDTYQRAATTLLSGGDYSAAIRIAQDGLKKHPDDKNLTLILAGSYNENADMNSAIRLLEDYSARYPKDQDVIEGLASLYIKTGQQDKATAVLSTLPRDGRSIDSDLFRAGVLTTAGKLKEARVILEELVKKDPDNFEAWLELAYIAEQQNDVSTAIRGYRKAASLMPANPEINFRLAALYIKQKNVKEAFSVLESGPADANAFTQIALRLADSAMYDDAETALNKAADRGASADEIAVIRSMVRQESSGSPKAGLAPLSTISPSSPMYGAALMQKARIYIESGEYDKAHKAASEGRKKFPEQKELWGLEAYSLVKMNKGSEAETLIKERLKQTPDDEDFLYSLGSVQEELGKRVDALATMERILAVNPQNYQALNYVGYTLAEENRDLERAHALISAALVLQPEASHIIDSLAWAEYRLGRYEDAWKSIRRCIELGGSEATIWEHYGDIALALGKKDEAAKGYTEAVARKPKNLNEVQRKLDGLK